MECKYKRHNYDKVEIEDVKLKRAMNRSIQGLAGNKDIAVKRKGCY